ncbi:hypothetical protein B9T26_09380 [Acinetobacter sp. ANC 4169]|uniref:shikimate kinase n=1 Tax=Acinetobacter sp. ANC 4169 TaxID=1977879 RepID=UPI000A340657|nr:shikimate kinase [Acinetobacter sp. ANC 4169]OTG73287.1 hypothetical protein B9T26_09380 [Acinetobacter sp. ANC 4169]
MLIHFIGPGGAGKTTTAKMLSKQLYIDYRDLDEVFMKVEGDISEYIDRNGYINYAKRNLEIYLSLKRSINHNRLMIMICSSGFMTYPEDISENYYRIKKQIENDSFTFLLLPSFDFETCVNLIVERQLQRSYLITNQEKEEFKIRKRLIQYLNLSCTRILTNEDTKIVVTKIQNIINYKLKK